MPIYMDRHDVSETVTAENVAHIHQEDLKIQDQFGCRGLTYWFDGKRKTAFCLIEAPDEMAIQRMHHMAHGQVPHHIIEVETSIVESFLGRIEDPENEANSVLNFIDDTAFRTIMVIRLKRLSLKQTDIALFNSTLPNYHKAVINLLDIHEGKLVNQSEGYFLVSFKSVSNAVKAALDVRSLQEFRSDLRDKKIHVKIGLSAGVPVTEKKVIFEDTIKTAERMCEVNGEIMVTSEVESLYNRENSIPLRKKESIFLLTQSDEKFLTLLMDFLESEWQRSNLKIDDFNKPLGCSKSQLYRKMILLTGFSPINFIKEYRLSKALTLLTKAEDSISEIAAKTGFSSGSYFSKCFQKRYHQLPTKVMEL